MSSFFYTCPSCGATSDSRAIDCCDYCIMTIFMERHAPDLDTMLRNYHSMQEWNEHIEEYPDAWSDEIE